MTPLLRMMKPVPEPRTSWEAYRGTNMSAHEERIATCWRAATLIETTAGASRSTAVTMAVRRLASTGGLCREGRGDEGQQQPPTAPARAPPSARR